MQLKPKSIRGFLGAKNFSISRDFYTAIGFEESIISSNMSLFTLGNVSFYLQDAYVKDWINNSMIFLEVEHLEKVLAEFQKLELSKRFPGVRVSEIVFNLWGNEFFLHDPSGILWHIGEFK